MPASSQDDNTGYGGSGEQDEVCCAQRCSGTRSGCLCFFGGFERSVYGVEYGLRLLNMGLSTLHRSARRPYILILGARWPLGMDRHS
jgi:hypothetical protein